MKNTELRIGNLITGIYDGDDEKEAICEVLAVDATQSLGEGWSIMVDSDESAECFDDFKPILLTEEWLIKFGFTYKRPGAGGQDSWSGYGFWSLNDISFLGIKDGKILYYNRIRASQIAYVHQLQNLYFALTGEELTIENLHNSK